MISVTPAAAKQIQDSATQGNMEGMPLRIAVTRLEDGSFHYAMGFDDASHADDKTFRSEGIDIVVAPQSLELLTGTVIDYVELDGKWEIIFINPNDPVQKA
ncbi:MAG TPA: Fe-S cluster assembly protein HesB [Gammaproteobacteria bacterium]|nr:Fe-S cluster assembly protein HesB [Gammaproteobacteria bacterium]